MKPVICSKARLLAMILNGLMSIGMKDEEILELLKPKNIKGGIAILKETQHASVNELVKALEQ